PALANVAEVALFFLVRHVAHGPPSLDEVAHDRGLVLLLGIGTTVAVATMAFALAPSFLRARIRLRPNFDWRHPAVRKVLALSGWTVGYVAVNQAALWVTLVLANGHRGGVAAYQGAFIFFQLPHGLFAVSLMTTITPELPRAGSGAAPPATGPRSPAALASSPSAVLPP